VAQDVFPAQDWILRYARYVRKVTFFYNTPVKQILTVMAQQVVG